MKPLQAWLESINSIKVDLDYEDVEVKAPDMVSIHTQEETFTITILQPETHHLWIQTAEPLPLHTHLAVTVEGVTLPVYFGAVVRSKPFQQVFAAPEEKLGVFPSKNETQFAVWAPGAEHVGLYVDETFYSLRKKTNGIWHGTVPYNAHGHVYYYEVTRNGETVKVIDPYAPSLTVNSNEGIVIDPAQTKPPADDTREQAAVSSLEEASIYELHVRDATSHPMSGVQPQYRGKFLGLTETDTKTGNGYSTGLSYLKELGVSHVQLLPLNDYGRVDERNPAPYYNWGYDPLFFQAPEGSYATTASDPLLRVTECQEMIEAFHQAGLSVIVDVVFNHVFIHESSAFEQLVPGYYFRYDENGELSNGTGVGNDIASERPMVRKFILDTVDHWLLNYKVDGFRFDLMGALDIETMQAIRARCDQENVPVLLLGEGWDLPTALNPARKATSFHSAKLPGIAFFNDAFRDIVKGSTFAEEAQGYMNGEGKGKENLYHLFAGSTPRTPGLLHFEDPRQSINYVESHDNLTLFDKLALSNRDDSLETRRRIHQLATSFTILSLGIPFLHAGQEMYRTKGGDANSYLSGDSVNALDWQAREDEDQTISFVKKLLATRRAQPLFQLSDCTAIEARVHELTLPGTAFGTVLTGEKEDITCLWNPERTEVEIRLPRPGRWQVRVTNEGTLPTEIQGERLTLPALTCVVLERRHRLG
ncbi:type I pullulanase [Salsuginibacillus kocurii]|uniref:type I pullulanase n=1 Tax=Salsuginibacillus kocurii TaxID=427078 RepID=UPI000367B5E4|nr:type I pullulanase [Salsuginibacillus kocurii]